MLLVIEPTGADATENLYGAGLVRGALACGVEARRLAVADAQAAAEALRAAGAAQVVIDARLLAGLDEGIALSPGLAAILQHESALGPRDQIDPRAYESLSRLRRVVVPGAAAAEALAARVAISPEQILTLPPGTDPADRASGAGNGCALLWHGRCLDDAAILLGALRRLPDLDWSLRLAVPATAVAPIGVERVCAVDARDRVAMENAWNDTDLLAVVSDWHLSDQSLRDGLRRGVPAVVCAGGGAGEALEADLGLGVSPGDAEQLSKALRRMIFDRPLRTGMAEAACRRGGALPGWDMQARTLLATLAA